MREAVSILFLVTFIPVVLTAIMCTLVFYRLGYGRVGSFMSTGFIILVASLLLGLINSIYGWNDTLQVVAGVVRFVGWSGIAMSFIYLWQDADRSIP